MDITPVGKIRKHGILRLFRRAAAGLVGGPVRAARRAAGTLSWAFPPVADLLPGRRRRLLAVYDLSRQPFSIGDLLLIQEATLVVREQHGLDLVDFALVYDPKQPACADPAFAGVTAENVLYHLASILPVTQVNPHHGSLFIFNSHRQLHRFIADNAAAYHVWPSLRTFASGAYLNYPVYNELLYPHFQKHGSLPSLSCRPFLLEWAQDFYLRHVYPSVPVTVNVRNNPATAPNRNLRLESWFDFFRYCEHRYPVRFVIICALAEVDARMRSCPNALVAKDLGTNIEQDLALIQQAAMHMGASSGPCTMACFNRKPYLIVNTDVKAELNRMLIREGNSIRYCFAGPCQRFTVGPETTELLIAEFERMWESLPESSRAMANGHQAANEGPLTWLR